MVDKKIIVFGGSGFIGKKLCDYFSKKNELLFGTCNHSFKPGLFYFNLLNPDLSKLNTQTATHAIICSAVTRPDVCKEKEAESYQINVAGTKRLLEQLFELDIFPVFFSSEYVFNGERGNYSESDETNPNTVYGSHKKIIEDFLAERKEPHLIARLGKVFSLDSQDKTFLTSIANQLRNDEILQCAEDQIFCPTYVHDLVEVVDLALEKNLNGLYNMASQEYFSRFQIAQMIKSRLKIKSGKIISCSLKDMNFKDSRPLNTSLNSDKLINATGFRFTWLEDCIDKLKILQDTFEKQ